jgi:hypothetical protein
MCETARCIEQKIINEKQINIQQEAVRLANETGQWVAIYQDEGGLKCIRADLAQGLLIRGFASPNNRDPAV